LESCVPDAVLIMTLIPHPGAVDSGEKRHYSAVAIGELRFIDVFVAVREFINVYSKVSCYSDCGESPKSFDFVEVKHSQRRS